MSRNAYKIRTLGANGWIPSFSRHTSCYVLEFEESLFIFDLGTGACRLGEPYSSVLLNKFEEVNILLSHYHLDHISGLTYLPLYLRNMNVNIYGPGRGIYGKSTFKILNDHLEKPYFALSLEKYPMNLRCYDIKPGNTEICGHNIDVIMQEHSDPTLGYKIDNIISYITDTTCSERTIEFVKGSEILLHETWFDNIEYEELTNIDKRHSEDVSIALKVHANVNWVTEVARRAGVNKLVLIHQNPSYSNDRLISMEKYAKSLFENSCLAVDGTEIVTEGILES